MVEGAYEGLAGPSEDQKDGARVPDVHYRQSAQGSLQAPPQVRREDQRDRSCLKSLIWPFTPIAKLRLLRRKSKCRFTQATALFALRNITLLPYDFDEINRVIKVISVGRA